MYGETDLFDVLEECKMLPWIQDTVSERSGITLHPSMHHINEVHLNAHQSVNGLLFSFICCWHSLQKIHHSLFPVNHKLFTHITEDVLSYNYTFHSCFNRCLTHLVSIHKERERGAGDEVAGQGEDSLVHRVVCPLAVIGEFPWVVVLASPQLHLF